MSMPQDIYTFLDKHSVEYQKFDHPAVYTVEEAERLTPKMPGVHIKNLLIKNKKAKRLFLLVVGVEKRIDLKALGKRLGVERLSFASSEQLKEYLGVEPGAVTLLGIINDTQGKVEVLFDEAVAQADAIQCHPLVNTATLVISQAGIQRFVKAAGYTTKVIDIPARAATLT